MINYFNFEKRDGKYLLTNDFGKYAFVNEDTFHALVQDKVSDDNPAKQELLDKGFLIKGSIEGFIQKNIPWLQGMKGYCLCGTALHIFAVTNKCNLDCIYCQAHSKSSVLEHSMTKEIGRRAIEFAMQTPNKSITFEFQGGEPLLNFPVIREMIDYSKQINTDKEIVYTIVTNLLGLTEEMLAYLVENDVHICTSLDGPACVHNHNRPRRGGGESYAAVMDKIHGLQKRGIKVNAIETTTNFSLKYPKEIIDQYLEAGMNGIFLRPLTPLGMADADWQKVGYTPAEFMAFYQQAFDYIMRLNLSGTYFPELHASYFLKKILGSYADNYMELRSPCGAGVGQMSYYHDGNVYTCDEGRMLSEMGDQSFLLGNVMDNSFNDAVTSPVCAAVCKASIVEALPKCAQCVYQPYCGVCPVVNYASTNSLYESNSRDFRCTVYKGIMQILFDILENGDPKKIEVLKSWID